MIFSHYLIDQDKNKLCRKNVVPVKVKMIVRRAFSVVLKITDIRDKGAVVNRAWPF